MKPRLLHVARAPYRWPVTGAERRKLDALGDAVELRVLASGENAGDDRISLVPRPLFHLTLPARVARELRRFRPDAVLVQGTNEAAAVLLGRRLARSDAKVILDVQGDWRQAPRLYGSPLRRLAAPATDRVARAAVRGVDAVRTVSEATTAQVRDLGVEPVATFPSYTDLVAFGGPPEPLSDEPRVLFVGALERVKGFDVLVEAWPRVRVGSLSIVGDGSLYALAGGLDWRPSRTAEQIARELDRSWALCLPSRSEGLPRVALEALSRGRAVIGSDVGGIPDVVRNEENGLLVPPGDPEALARALRRLVSDRALAERLGAQAHADAALWRVTPEQWAARIRTLVDGLSSP